MSNTNIDVKELEVSFSSNEKKSKGTDNTVEIAVEKVLEILSQSSARKNRE